MKEKLYSLTKNKVVWCCLILAFVYVLSGYCKWIEIGLPVLATFMFLCLNLQQGFCVFLFMHNFTLSNISYTSCLCATLVCYCVVLVVKCVYGLIKQKYKLNKWLLFSMLVFLLVTIVISLPKAKLGDGYFYLTYMPIIFCLYTMRNEFDIIQAMNYFCFGLFLSCGLSLLTFILPNYQYFCVKDGRFLGFINHTNYLCMRAVLVVTFYMFRCLNEKLKFWQFALIYCACFVITLSTLSKTGIILLAFLSLVFFTIYVCKNIKKRIIYVLLFVFILGVLCLIFREKISVIFNRFFANGKLTSNSILTGRDDIWRAYWQACTDSPWHILFGNGLMTEEVFIPEQNCTRASHNLYLFLLYRFGVLGIVALVIMFVFAIKEIKNKPKFIAFLPLIWYLIESMVDNVFKSYNFMFLPICIMILFSSTKIEQKNLQKEKSDLIKKE